MRCRHRRGEVILTGDERLLLRLSGFFETDDKKEVYFGMLALRYLLIGIIMADIFVDANGISTIIIVSPPRTTQLKWDRENNPGRHGGTAAMQFVFALSEQSRYARNSPLYHSCARVA